MTEEIWKPVVGFEGLYEVSNLGRVRSFARGAKGRILRPGKSSGGHFSVVLGRGNTRTVHSLVADAFIGPRPPGREVRHKDGKHLNNVNTNLEYATRSRNTQDKKWHDGAVGYVLKPADVIDIKRRLGPLGMGAILAAEYGVAQSTISAIKHGVFHKDIVV